MILGFKGFKPGLVATLGNGTFRYVPNELNETEKAMCASTGFHYCLDPWDCLNWYTWNGKNEFWAVAAGGDVDEDGYGSRSSCTKLVPLRKLTAEEFLLMHANYVFEHPAEKFEDSYKGPFHVAYVEQTYKILSEGSYVPTRPKLKTIYDDSSQKQRELKIVPFWPDGIVHRLIVEVMKPVLMRGMHPYSCASIPGRGGARIRKYLAHAMSCDPKGTRYACEMDIRHFYPSVPIRRLIRTIGRKIKDKRFLRLIWAILKSCGQGLAIGYYICQWLANFYLEKLDWMLARMPGVKYYTRYMDNITMLGPNKRMLHRARVAAEKFLRDELGLAVKENWQVYRTAVARKAKGRPRAVSAVGFRFWHGFTTLRRRNFLRMLRQARRIQKKQKMGIPVSVQQAAGFLSRAGQLNHCNSFRVKEKYIRSIKIKHLKEVIRNESKRQCKAGWALYGRTPPATA